MERLFLEYSQLLLPEAVVPRFFGKMLFHRKIPMAGPYCNYWRKFSNFNTIGRLRHDCFPMSLHHSTRDSRFCTSSNKSTTFYKILSFAQFFPRHCVPYLSFWSLSLFCNKQEFSVTFYGSMPSCKHGGSFLSSETLLILFQVFFIIALHVGEISDETCPPSLKWN